MAVSLLPPRLQGPITTASRGVVLSGVVKGAMVAVSKADGSLVVSKAAYQNGIIAIEVPSGALLIGDVLTSTQVLDGAPSEASPDAVTVVAVPDVLPIPTITSLVHTHVSAVRVEGIVPGALVEVTCEGVTVGQREAERTAHWIKIRDDADTPVGSALAVRQSVDGQVSLASLSAPLAFDGRFEAPPLLPGMEAPSNCDTCVSAREVLPGAAFRISIDGRSKSWYPQEQSFEGSEAPQFTTGQEVHYSVATRMGYVTADQWVVVGPGTAPPAAVGPTSWVAESQQLELSNLTPGATLHVYFESRDGSRRPVGAAGITTSTETFALPSGLATPIEDIAKAPNQLVLVVESCAGISPETRISIVVSPTVYEVVPILRDPLHACSRTVLVTGRADGGGPAPLRPGTVQLYAEGANGTAHPLSDRQLAQGRLDEQRVVSWLPLQAGMRIFVRARDGLAFRDSGSVEVASFASQLTPPTIVEPLLATSSAVGVTGAIPGARLHALSQGLEIGAADAAVDGINIIPVVRPLSERDSVTVVQTLCDQVSTSDVAPVVPRLSRTRITVKGSVPRPGDAAITVETHDEFGARTVMYGSVVARRRNGTVARVEELLSFESFTLHADADTAAFEGTIRERGQNSGGTFIVPVRDAVTPPPPPGSTLTLEVNEVISGAPPTTEGQYVYGASWTVTPLWGDKKARTASGLSATVTDLPGLPAGATSVIFLLALEVTVVNHYPPEADVAVESFLEPAQCAWRGISAVVRVRALPGVGTPPGATLTIVP